MEKKEEKVEERVERIMRESAKYWGNFETAQDRKYFLWDQLSNGFIHGGKRYGDPFKIELLIGSNQVVLKRGNKTIYNSDFDNFGGMEDFILFLTEIIREVEAGHEKAEGSGGHIFHIPISLGKTETGA